MRGKKIKLLGLIMCVALLLGSVAPVMAAEFYEKKKAEAHWMAFDALVVRPLSAVEVVLGAGLWVLSLPTMGAGQSTASFTDAYINDSFTFAFDRPTGDF